MCATTQLELGGLGDDRRVDRGTGEQPANHFLDPEARVLLVGDGGHDDVAGEPALRELTAGDERGGESCLHVVGAATVESIAVQTRRVGIGHPLDGHRVVVTAQQQRPPAAAAPPPDDHARPARGLFEHLGVEAAPACPADHELGDLALAGAADNERRVDRVDRHHRFQELERVRRHRANPDRSRRSASAAP
ncbi:MAG: hypothetical protein WAN22_32650 [Solirubrobacteraceae bacterium]